MMITITDAVIAEHAVFVTVFDQIERMLPHLDQLAETKVLTKLLVGLLENHRLMEENMAFAALDHALAFKGQLDRLYEDHLELDTRFKEAQKASTIAQASALLREAISATREHFQREEQVELPLLAKLIQEESLLELGAGWLRQRQSTRQDELLPAALTS
jgi:hypothetical protein